MSAQLGRSPGAPYSRARGLSAGNVALCPSFVFVAAPLAARGAFGMRTCAPFSSLPSRAVLLLCLPIFRHPLRCTDGAEGAPERFVPNAAHVVGSVAPFAHLTADAVHCGLCSCSPGWIAVYSEHLTPQMCCTPPGAVYRSARPPLRAGVGCCSAGGGCWAPRPGGGRCRVAGGGSDGGGGPPRPCLGSASPPLACAGPACPPSPPLAASRWGGVGRGGGAGATCSPGSLCTASPTLSSPVFVSAGAPFGLAAGTPAARLPQLAGRCWGKSGRKAKT